MNKKTNISTSQEISPIKTNLKGVFVSRFHKDSWKRGIENVTFSCLVQAYKKHSQVLFILINIYTLVLNFIFPCSTVGILCSHGHRAQLTITSHFLYLFVLF